MPPLIPILASIGGALGIGGAGAAALGGAAIKGFIIRTAIGGAAVLGLRLLNRKKNNNQQSTIVPPKRTIRAESGYAPVITGEGVRVAGQLFYYGSLHNEARMAQLINFGPLSTDGPEGGLKKIWINNEGIYLKRTVDPLGDLYVPVENTPYSPRTNYSPLEIRLYPLADGTQGSHMRISAPVDAVGTLYDGGEEICPPDSDFFMDPDPFFMNTQPQPNSTCRRMPTGEVEEWRTPFPPWTTEHKVNGYAWVYIKMRQSFVSQGEDRIYTGIPNFEFLVRGIDYLKIYGSQGNGMFQDLLGQPDSWYEENMIASPILARYHLEVTLGGHEQEDFDGPNMLESINFCHSEFTASQNVPIDLNGYKHIFPRYEANGYYDHGMNIEEIRDQLDTQMQGQLVEVGKKFEFRIGRDGLVPVAHITQDDLLEPSTVSSWNSIDSRVNSIEIELNQSNHPDYDYARQSLPEVIDNPALVKDQRKLKREVRLTFENNAVRGLLNASKMLRRIRESERYFCLVRPREDFSLLELNLYDIVEVSDDEYGKVRSRMEVEKKSVVSDGRVKLVLREEIPGTYADTYVAPPLVPRNIRLENPLEVTEVENLQVGQFLDISKESLVFGLLIFWDFPEFAQDTFIEIINTENGLIEGRVFVERTSNSYFHSPVKSENTYKIRARHRNEISGSGKWSDYVDYTVNKDSTIPGEIENLQVSERENGFYATWKNPDDPDFDHCKLRVLHTTPVFRDPLTLEYLPSEAIYRNRTEFYLGLNYRGGPFGPGIEVLGEDDNFVKIYASAVDKSGNESPEIGPVTVYPLDETQLVGRPDPATIFEVEPRNSLHSDDNTKRRVRIKYSTPPNNVGGRIQLALIGWVSGSFITGIPIDERWLGFVDRIDVTENGTYDYNVGQNPNVLPGFFTGEYLLDDGGIYTVEVFLYDNDGEESRPSNPYVFINSPNVQISDRSRGWYLNLITSEESIDFDVCLLLQSGSGSSTPSPRPENDYHVKVEIFGYDDDFNLNSIADHTVFRYFPAVNPNIDLTGGYVPEQEDVMGNANRQKVRCHNVVISDLSPGTRYRVKLTYKARSFGSGINSNTRTEEFEFQTTGGEFDDRLTPIMPGTCPDPPTNYSVEGVIGGIRATWTNPNDVKRIQNLEIARFYYSTSNIFQEEGPRRSIDIVDAKTSDQTYSRRILGLDAGTTYYVWMVLINSSGNCPDQIYYIGSADVLGAQVIDPLLDPAPGTPTIDSISVTLVSLSLIITLPSDSDRDQLIIEYSTDSTFETEVIRNQFSNLGTTHPSGTNLFSATITGLSQNTTYYIRVSVIDSAAQQGPYATGNARTVNELLNIDEPILDSIEARVAALRISWLNPTNTELSSIKIQYSRFSSFSSFVQVSIDNPIPGSSNNSRTISGLLTGTRYYVRIRAEYSSGAISDWTNSLSAITLTSTGVPRPDPVRNVTISFSGRSATIGFITPDYAGIESIKILRGTTDVIGDATEIARLSSGSYISANTINSYTSSGLNYSTDYWFWLIVVSEDAFESTFVLVSGETEDESLPDPPSNSSIVTQSDGYRVTWDNPAGIVGIYTVRVYENTVNSFSSAHLRQGTLSGSYTRTGLIPGSVRHVWIQTHLSGVGTSSPVYVGSVTVPESVRPSPPVYVSSSVSGTQLSIRMYAPRISDLLSISIRYGTSQDFSFSGTSQFGNTSVFDSSNIGTVTGTIPSPPGVTYYFFAFTRRQGGQANDLSVSRLVASYTPPF